MNYQTYDKQDLTAAEPRSSSKSTGLESVKTTIADQLDAAAEALGEKVDQVGHEGLAEYGNQASEWLGKSAEYVREFDFKQAETDVRECIRQHPGSSLLAAGVVGFVVGAILRRR